jgi:beta-lactam-binding protein with PASTA domain
MQQAVQAFEPGSFTDPGPQPIARVPDLSEITSISEMRDIVEAADLRLFVETVEDYRPENTFVRQLPEAGQSVPAGRAVIVELSDESLDPPEVPDFIGKERQAAVDEAVEAGFTVVVQQRDTDVPAEVGTVIAQSRAPGTSYIPENEPQISFVIGRQAPEEPPSEEPPAEEPPAEEPPAEEPPAEEPPPEDPDGD